MDTDLAGKGALLTGGASGIGQALAIGLAHEGARVVIADREDATATLALADSLPGTASAVRIDLSTEEAVIGLVHEAESRLGQIDLFVNVAAIARHEGVLDLTRQAWHDTLSTNVEACVWAGREIGRSMASAGRGSILIVGSTVAFHPAYTEAAYRASKVALRSYMETLSIELAPHGVRVNMLTPGAFKTPLAARIPAQQLAVVERAVPLGRRGDPVELVPTALLLLSDALSPYTTGAEFVVDGGLHHHPLRHE